MRCRPQGWQQSQPQLRFAHHFRVAVDVLESAERWPALGTVKICSAVAVFRLILAMVLEVTAVALLLAAEVGLRPAAEALLHTASSTASAATRIVMRRNEFLGLDAGDYAAVPVIQIGASELVVA